MDQCLVILKFLLNSHFNEIQDEIYHCLQNVPIHYDISRNITDDPETISKAKQAEGWVMSWTKDPNWLNLGFYMNNEKLPTSKHCPMLIRAIESTIIPESRVLIGLSLLRAGGKIPSHTDQYTLAPKGLRFRVILYGIVVPDECKLTVENKFRFMKEQEMIEFDDRKQHSIENNSDKDRVILYMKILDKV